MEKRKKDVCVQTETQKGIETERHMSWHSKTDRGRESRIKGQMWTDMDSRDGMC